MGRSAWPTVGSGDMWSASNFNTYGRDNDLAYWAFTTAGDMVYATSSLALARLALGSARQWLRTNSGATAPEWATYLDQNASVTFSSDVTYTTLTYVSFSITNFDTGSFFSLNTRLTAPVSGYYHVGIQAVYTVAGSTNDIIAGFYKNHTGNPFWQTERPENPAVNGSIEGSTVIHLLQNDYVEFFINPGGSAPSVTIKQQTGLPNFWIQRWR